MSKFHINPTTGNPNVCPNEWECKFANAEGIIPPHYATKDEAKKAVEDQIFAAFSAPQASSDTPTEADAPTDEDPRGPESFEKAVEIARRTAITLATKKQDALVGLKELKKKAPKLKAVPLKLKKRS
jgi:hypothetical protein